jgi:hypothetical protein
MKTRKELQAMSTSQLLTFYRTERQRILNDSSIYKLEMDDDGELIKNNDWISMQLQADKVKDDLKYLNSILTIISKRKDKLPANPN